MTTRLTPATLAGMAFMSTVEGYCARRPAHRCRRRERGHLNAEHRAVRACGKPALLDLALVELTNLACSLFERHDKSGIEAFERGIDLFLRQAEACSSTPSKR